MRTPGTAAELERRRLLAAKRLDEGYSAQEVAEFLDVDLSTVHRWERRYRKFGEAGLRAKPHQRRRRFLSPARERAVLGWLEKSPQSFGFPTELWTAKRLALLIERKWGVVFNHRYLNTWLKKRGVTPQKPQRVAKEADPQAIEHWRKVEWPRLKNERDASAPTWSSSTKRGSS